MDAKTAKAHDTINTIIQKASVLFYENGIDNTSLDMIAGELSTSKGLITYHFKNKMNLVTEIRSEMLRKIKNIVANKYYRQYNTYDLQYGTALEFRAMLKWFEFDPKIFRFWHEANRASDGLLTEQTLNFYRLHIRKYHTGKTLTQHELEYMAMSAKSAVDGLVACYYNGNLHCDFETFADYRVKIPFFFLGVSEKRIAEIQRVSKELLDEMDIKYGPYFDIS